MASISMLTSSVTMLMILFNNCILLSKPTARQNTFEKDFQPVKCKDSFQLRLILSVTAVYSFTPPLREVHGVKCLT